MLLYFFAISLIILLVTGCAPSGQSPEKEFTASFRKSFTASCIESAIKGPTALTKELAQSKCDCMASYLVTTFSATELTRLSDGSSTETSRIVEQTISSCK